MSAEKDDLLQRLQMAEQAERYADMSQIVKQIIEMSSVLTAQERNAFSTAYKNRITPLRNSYQTISDIALKTVNQTKLRIANEYLDKLGQDLCGICEEAVALINGHLLSKANDAESRVFYHKLIGDYYRYESEVTAGDSRKAILEKAHNAYEEAYHEAQISLPGGNYVRVGLALNFSVFLYELQDQRPVAVRMAREAIEQAGTSTTSSLVQLLNALRDNLSLWKRQQNGQADAQ